MNTLAEIYEDLVFYKIRTHSGYTTYAALIDSLLSDGYRYVILLVPEALSYYDKTSIRNIQWSCLQTRLLQEKFQIPSQVLDSKKLDTRYHSKTPLTLVSRDSKKTDYVSDQGFFVSLLHNPKKNTVYQYADDIDLRRALNTYSCVIKF